MPDAQAPTAAPRRGGLRRQYAHPPVRELIIDIQVALDQTVALAAAGNAAAAELAKRYPQSSPLTRHNFGALIVADNVTTSTSHGPDGVILLDGATKRRIQIRGEGFAYHSGPGLGAPSNLPYGGWEANRDAAKQAWRTYAAHFPVRQITRLGVRYVNQIDLPVPADIDDYLLTGPRVGPALPQSMVALGFQIGLQVGDSRQAFVRQAVIGPTAADRTGLVLDIDVFDVAVRVPDDDQIWTILGDLHEIENDVFEGSITDKTRSLFA